MIKLYDKNRQEIKYEATIFPDKTSQCWKVEKINEVDTILWQYEREWEVFHLFQLLTLLPSGYKLVMPYLPFARQDKSVGNTNTFARQVLLDILYHQFHVHEILCVDPHSKNVFGNGSKNFLNITDMRLQNVMFTKALSENEIICFPDKGAKLRYGFNNKPVIFFNKVRNQQSGVIESIELDSMNGFKLSDIENKKIIIIDDLCDGGGTFVKAAKVLEQYNPLEVNLAITHGIFSAQNGILNLLENGINKIYTTNTYIRYDHVENQIAANMDRVNVTYLDFI